MRYRGRPDLTAPQQLLHLQRNTICTGFGGVKKGLLTWRFWASPTPLSRQYLIRLHYEEGHAPQIFVETPDLLKLARGRKIPHIYSESPLQLCLYLPRSLEWQGHARLDETVVPWAYLWLEYFEEWLWSDDWKGGGRHPEAGPEEGLR